MEKWKEIQGYEGYYEVSNLGDVRSLDKVINCKGARNIDQHMRKGRILKKHIDTRGYYTVNLSKDSQIKVSSIHRLVAVAFLENQLNLPCVNHIDGDKLNNNMNNLEWCSYSHNNKEAYRIGLKEGSCKNKLGKDSFLSKPIVQYSLDGEFIREWENASQVKRELGYCAENIRNVCKGRRKKANGFIWKYREER